MAFILLFALFASQFLILYWKKKHYKSYQSISLGGLYFFPALFALYSGWYRFLIFWALFSVLNGVGKSIFFFSFSRDKYTYFVVVVLIVIYKASRKPLESMTPRMVYKWFTVLYNVSFVVGLIGYLIILGVFFGIAAMFGIGPEFIQVGILLLSYGLYFG